MKRYTGALWVGAVVLLILAIFGWTHSRTVLLQGEVVIRQLNVTPRIVGRVEEIRAREGDRVQKGQVLATLYAPDMLARASQAQAPRELAQKSYARVQELYDGGVVSAQKLDEAKAQVGRAEGSVREVESYVQEMQLTSPADGEVAEVVLEQGELASPGVSVLTVLDLSDVWVTFHVREDLLASFRLQDTLPIGIPALGKDTYPFRITYISKQGDYAVWSATKTRGEFDLKTFEVRAKPVQPLPQLRQGMTALLKVPA